MDRQTLHDLGGRAVKREDESARNDGAAKSDFLQATPRPRRIPTDKQEKARRMRLESEDLLHDDSFVDSTMSSQNSFPTVNTSWDEQSDDEGNARNLRRDHRKSGEATTPTLIDEVDFVDDEEHEMVSLERERERLRQSSQAFFGKDHSDLRRTPGAQMYRSDYSSQGVRRTPGASQMHGSVTSLNVMQQESGSSDAAPALGFGLTLSTPVASSNRGKQMDLSTAWEGSSTSSTDSPKEGKATQVARPPLGPSGSNSKDQRGNYGAPWTLSKNAHLESSRSVYSPNTLRLTEDLGNLLLEDENGLDDSSKRDNQRINREALSKGGDGKGHEASESWTASYVISMDAPSRVPKSSSGRSRRSRSDGIRRSRALDRTNSGPRDGGDQGPKTGGFLQHAQYPKPVRNAQPKSLGNFAPNQFNFGSAAKDNAPKCGANVDGDVASPRVLNFGGAFEPPSKMYGGTFRNQLAPSPSGTEQTICPVADISAQNVFPTNNAAFPQPVFHTQMQQAQGFIPHPGKFQHQFLPQEPMYTASANMKRSPTFNFPPQNMGYMHPPPPPQNFLPNMSVHHPQRQPMGQFAPPPQVWPQAMHMPYDRMSMEHPSWHGPHGAWAMGEYGYGMPSRIRDSAGMHSWNAPEGVDQSAGDIQTNPFSMMSQSAEHAGAQFTGQTGRNSNRTKNQRKNSSRRGQKGQPKNDRGQKQLDASNSSAAGKKSSSNSSKNKKKQSKEKTAQGTSHNSSTAQPSNEDRPQATDDPIDPKRAGLTESPATRSAFKDFYRKFRMEERTSFQSAEKFAMQALSNGSLPESIHWKVYLELADLSKRANKFVDARKLYQQVCHLQPYASQGWLEYSKLEEECGNMSICAKILRAGLEYCEYSENLLTRAIKHEEKMGNLGRARELLARLKHVGIEKVWRTVLEGALLEARAGNHVMSRRVLKYLMHHVPWYGPLYLEAYRLERDLGRSKEALVIVERGLGAIPRYGPLWFGAFRLCEELDLEQKNFNLPQAMAMINRATFSISKELIWKVHLEAAQMLERTAIEYLDHTTEPTANDIMDVCRKRFAMTILTCPQNLRWKVWLAAGRMEVAAGNSDTARKLFLRAHQVVPEKGRAVALLECARLEEFVGDVDLARAILCKSRSKNGSDWKVWLESVLLEIRCRDYNKAIKLAQSALKQHTGTGRLWASLVQLRQFGEGEKAQFESLKLALNAVPKSGEVWCEGARIHLNPFAKSFDLVCARRHLFFATKFTPQYGDGFLESLRLEIIERWLEPIARLVWERTQNKVFHDTSSVWNERAIIELFQVIQSVHAACNKDNEDVAHSLSYLDDNTISSVRNLLESYPSRKILDISGLQLRCANADPNYGSLWFHCRAGPTDTARKVLFRATELMLQEIRSSAHIYISGFIRRYAVLARLRRGIQKRNARPDESSSCPTNDEERLEEELEIQAYQSAPSLQEIIDGGKQKSRDETGVDLLESTMASSDFVSGLVALSRQKPMKEMLLPQRRKALFGTDALFS